MPSIFLAAVHLFLYLEVAPGKKNDLGSNSFNSGTNAAAGAAAAAAAAAASAACIYYEVLGGRRWGAGVLGCWGTGYWGAEVLLKEKPFHFQ